MSPGSAYKTKPPNHLQPCTFAAELGAQPTQNKCCICARGSDAVFIVDIRKSGVGKVMRAHTHRKAD